MKPDPAGLRLAKAVQAYAEAVERACRDGRRPPRALPAGSGVTQTEVMVAVDALLRAAELEVFEVQIWRSLGRGA
jgi:hypothetical protein